MTVRAMKSAACVNWYGEQMSPCGVNPRVARLQIIIHRDAVFRVFDACVFEPQPLDIRRASDTDQHLVHGLVVCVAVRMDLKPHATCLSVRKSQVLAAAEEQHAVALQ